MLRRAVSRTPSWVLAVVGLLTVAAALLAVAVLGGQTLPERTGPPIEELAVERTVLSPGTIELTLRNTGPDPVQVGQVAVNDGYVQFTGGEEPIGRLGSGTLRLAVPWQDGQPYLVSILTSTGAVIEHQIPVATATPQPNGGFVGQMVLLGAYVGIIPVLLGMLFLPAIRRAGRRTVRVLLALTVGLLAFLAADATIEAVELAGQTGAAFGGVALVVLGAVLAFLALTAVARWLQGRQSQPGSAPRSPGGLRLALMIAIGIGLHNLGEGLAIGSAYAVGNLAIGASLVVGFAVHNTTEGLAVVVPVPARPVSLWRLLGLGLIAGAPAVAGTLLGSTVANAELSALLLGIGIGAIAQVIVQIAPSLRDRATGLVDSAAFGGLAAGVLLMYATGLLVAV
ncbi:MAG: ZIP family metal transporter [Geodermatophilaceae bacterium]|nr:ZIP family metal transporter [Geodermatophilaceae bacterium]